MNDQLHETIAQQNNLITSLQLTIYEYQRQIADLRSRYNEVVERNRELEDQLVNKVAA
jgi:uncharacterized coiled-coil protein SlyX